MRLDLLTRAHGRPCLVADCKYKRITHSDAQSHDVYQVLAYCTATNVRHGALIYPAHSLSMEDDIAVRHSDVRIRRISIDLSCRGSGIQSRMRCVCFSGPVVAPGRTHGRFDELNRLLSPAQTTRVNRILKKLA